MLAALAATTALCVEFSGAPTIRRRRDPSPSLYAVDVSALPQELASTFVLSELDDETRAFTEASRNATTTLWGQWKLFIKDKLYWMLVEQCRWGGVDASAFLRKSQMFVASRAQLGRLLERAAVPTAAVPNDRMLDVGAGRGDVTNVLATALHIDDPMRVFAMESSAPIRRELRRRWGYRAVAGFEDVGSEPFHVVALLNVLDRIDEPAGMLRAAAGLLQPQGGILIVSTVLPFRGEILLPENYVRRPRRPLKLEQVAATEGSTRPPRLTRFERAGAAFVRAVLREAGASTGASELLAWTRLPYLSSADVSYTHHVLEHALFVVRVPGRVLPDGVAECDPADATTACSADAPRSDSTSKEEAHGEL